VIVGAAGAERHLCPARGEIPRQVRLVHATQQESRERPNALTGE